MTNRVRTPLINILRKKEDEKTKENFSQTQLLIRFTYWTTRLKMNNSTFNDELENSYGNVGLTLSLIATVVLTETLGNLMYGSIMFYEKYEMDPMKRSLANTLAYYFCATSMAYNFANLSLFVARFAYGPMGAFLADVVVLINFAYGLNLLLTINQMMFYKVFCAWKWHLAARLNDDFLATFLLSANLMLIFCVVGVRYLFIELYRATNFAFYAGFSGCSSDPLGIMVFQM